MPRVYRHLSIALRVIIFAFAGKCLLGESHAALQREGDSAVLTDRPRCRFAWSDWDYTNVTNPLLLTKNTLDRSMIGIMRIRAGDTLPQGKTKVSANMTAQQITALLRENLQGRGQRVESLTVAAATVGGTPAVRLTYTQPALPVRKRAVEFGFMKNGYFFHLLCVIADGPDYSRELKDFQKVVSTFRVLE